MTREYAYKLIETAIPALPGWCSVDKAKRIARLCADRRLRVGVELGVFGGRSLVAMAIGCACNGFGRVDGIDPYEKQASLEGTNSKENDHWWSELDYDDVMQHAVRGIEQNALGPYTCLLRMKSIEAVDRYEDGSVDVMHQDSNHSEEVSCAEVRAYAPKIALGGFWIMDDIDWSTTKRAQELLVEIGFQRIEEHGGWALYQAVGGELKR